MPEPENTDKHIPLTREQLEENLRKTQEDIDKLAATDPVDDVDDDEDADDLDTDKKLDQDSDDDTQDDDEGADADEPEDKTTPKDDDSKNDIQKRYTESTREAQRLYQSNIKVTDAIAEADSLSEPTDEEMIKQFPDEWEALSPFEKRLAKDNELSKRKLKLISDASKEGKVIQEWNEKVDKYLEDPQIVKHNPDLTGKEDEFKLFASQKENRGANFDLLVGSFLHNLAKTPKVKHKGKMFETGSGGRNEKPVNKTDKLSLDDSRKLMKTDYPKWKQMLKEGKLQMGV